MWRRHIAGTLLALLVLVAAFQYRRIGMAYLFALVVNPPPLSPMLDEGVGIDWFDEYFTVEWIDAKTIAIGEPRYYQANYSYLILGEQRALLFDSGPGLYDIRPLVETLTPLEVTAVPSHLHYDHIGNHMRYERLAVIDLPYLRERTRGGVLRPTYWEHLGSVEGFARPDLRVTEWWTPDSWVDLGGRRLRVLHTPGHTYDSLSLWDEERALLFTGDYIHQGAVFAFLPGSSLGDYLRTAERLGEQIPENTTLLTAHRAAPSGVPRMATRDLIDLRETLRQIRAGEAEGAGYPVVFEVNERLLLLADFPLLEDWD